MDPVYTIKGLKTFTGNEGQGYNVSLYRNGKRVAFVIDDASGGEVDFQWCDHNAPRVEFQNADFRNKGTVIRGTPEEKILNDFIRGKELPKEEDPALFEAIGQTYMTPDIFVGELVRRHREERDNKRHEAKLRTLCEKYTLIRITGDPEDAYRTVKLPDTPKLRASLTSLALAEKKEIIEFINDRYK
jgi:hypothetical protein